MQIIRVFPRRTSATPMDEYAYVGEPPLFLPDDVIEIHVSCTFTWDLQEAGRLVTSWSRFGIPVKLGGPACGDAGGDFVPGRYLKDGYVITSRGCPNRCWFCSVWKREGNVIRELPITDGHNLLDDNLLRCSEQHQEAVFTMLAKHRGKVEFTGGLEAEVLTDYHVDWLTKIKPKQMFFAYDTPNDLEPLITAGKKLLSAGFTTASHALRCYVLIGYPKDTFEQAEQRLQQTVNSGFMPHAMLYRDIKGDTDKQWARFQRLWARPGIIKARMNEASTCR